MAISVNTANNAVMMAKPAAQHPLNEPPKSDTMAEDTAANSTTTATAAEPALAAPVVTGSLPKTPAHDESLQLAKQGEPIGSDISVKV